MSDQTVKHKVVDGANMNTLDRHDSLVRRRIVSFLALVLAIAAVGAPTPNVAAQAKAPKPGEQTTFEDQTIEDPVTSELAEIAAVKDGDARPNVVNPEPEEGGAPASEAAAKVGVPDEESSAAAKANAAEQAGLSSISHEVLIDEILRRMSSPDERTRLEAGLALRKTAKLSDVENLVKVLKRGNNRDKQLFLIETLGGLQDRRAGEALRFEVEHGDIETKRAAVTALGNLNFNWPIPVLVRTLRKSDDDELRKRAASALGQIASTQAVYALRTSLASLEESVGAKNAAFWALEKARGEVDDEQVDTKMPRGRRLQLFYKGTKYFFYHPANRRGAGINKVGLRPWLLVCVHDADLRAEELFNICWRAGKKRQMAVLVPVIDNLRFPEYGNFNMRGQRFDKRLIELIEHVGQYASLTTREIYLFGYGQGGDFVHRFTMAYPKRIARSAFESASYTMPDPEAIFPRGLTKSPLASDVQIDMYQFMKTDSVAILRKNSESLREGKEFLEAMQHFSDINGIRNRLGARTVEVKFEIWAEAEKFLFSYD